MYDASKIEVQMRKGVLEYIILLIISKGEAYSSDIINELQKYDLLIVEGTLYPLLSRLKKDQLLTYSRAESTSGPPRKYYKLTTTGKNAIKKMQTIRDQLNDAILGIQNEQ